MKKLLAEYGLIAPIIIGLIAGFMQELSKPKDSPHYWVKTIFTTSFIVFSMFLVLDMSDLTYHTKLGISAMFGFLGIEKALTYIKEFLHIFKK